MLISKCSSSSPRVLSTMGRLVQSDLPLPGWGQIWQLESSPHPLPESQQQSARERRGTIGWEHLLFTTCWKHLLLCIPTNTTKMIDCFVYIYTNTMSKFILNWIVHLCFKNNADGIKIYTSNMCIRPFPWDLQKFNHSMMSKACMKLITNSYSRNLQLQLCKLWWHHSLNWPFKFNLYQVKFFWSRHIRLSKCICFHLS